MLYGTFMKLPKSLRILLIRVGNRFRILQVNHLKTPRTLVYFVTNRCNARCEHCFYWKEIASKMNELTLDEIEKISKSMGSIRNMSLTGGDAILRKDLVEICETFYRNNGTKKFTLPTNGLLPEKTVEVVREMFSRMSKIELHVQISLDALEKEHDKMRGVKGCFKKAIETLKKIKELENEFKNLNLYVLTTITNKDYKDLDKLIEYVKELGVDHKFQLVRGAHFSVFNIDKNVLSDFDPSNKTILLPSIKELESFEKKLKKLHYKNELYKKVQDLKFRYSIEILKGKKVVKCLAGKIDGVLYPNGDVALCELTKSIGNLRDYNYNFEKLWNSKEANEMRKKIGSCFCTHSCNLVDSLVYDTETLIELAD